MLFDERSHPVAWRRSPRRSKSRAARRQGFARAAGAYSSVKLGFSEVATTANRRGWPYCPARLPVPNTMTFAPIGVRL